MSLEPRKWSTSGICAASSSGYRCDRQPLTTSFLQAPTRLYSASSKIVSIDSFFASPMKPQVLTTMTSASSGSSTTRQPSRPATPSITSVSTRFLTQPRLTKWILRSAMDERRCLAQDAAASPAHELHEPVEHVEGVVRDRPPPRGGTGR